MFFPSSPWGGNSFSLNSPLFHFANSRLRFSDFDATMQPWRFEGRPQNLSPLFGALKPVYEALEGKYDYGILRCVMAAMGGE